MNAPNLGSAAAARNWAAYPRDAFREPEAVVRAVGDAERSRVGVREWQLAGLPGWGNAPDLAGARWGGYRVGALGEPKAAAGADDDARKDVVGRADGPGRCRCPGLTEPAGQGLGRGASAVAEYRPKDLDAVGRGGPLTA